MQSQAYWRSSDLWADRRQRRDGEEAAATHMYNCRAHGEGGSSNISGGSIGGTEGGILFTTLIPGAFCHVRYHDQSTVVEVLQYILDQQPVSRYTYNSMGSSQNIALLTATTTHIHTRTRLLACHYITFGDQVTVAHACTFLMLTIYMPHARNLRALRRWVCLATTAHPSTGASTRPPDAGDAAVLWRGSFFW